MEALALHDFNSNDNDELPFRKGSTIKVLSTHEDKNWFKAEMDGREGFVPKNYIQLKYNGWYHGKLKREDAELLLVADGGDGSFLVRDCESTPGDFSLSVRYNSQVQHFKVLRDGSGKYFLWIVKFNSLNELIEYHRTSSVSRSQTIYLRDLKLPELFEALFDFKAEDEGELSFKAGEVIVVIRKENADWYFGSASSTRKGLFPASYVGPHKSATGLN